MSQILSLVDEVNFNGLEDYKSDPLVICRTRFIPKISGTTPPNDANESQEVVKAVFDINEWYPYCNSYYPHSEQVDAFARANHLLSGKESAIGSSQSIVHLEKSNEKKFFYSTRDCHIDYLRSKPLSFFILGKPSIGEEELGKQLADYWHCVYIDPETLIKEEIESDSRAGQCIEFNLRCGRAIGIDVILRLLEKRLDTESVAHRGFVLCGLPVIPNDLYEEDPVSAESAVFTVHEIFEEILDSVYDILSPPPLIPAPSRVRSTEEVSIKTSKIEWDDTQDEREAGVRKIIIQHPSTRAVSDDVVPLDLGDSKRSVCEPPEISTNYEEQLNFIMNLIEGPLLIIYMICENQDVINKRYEYRYDIYSETLIDLQRERAEKNLLSFFNQKNRLGLGVTNPPVELFEDMPRLLKDSSELVHLVRLPRDFPAHVQTQLQTFHDIAAKMLEARILEHNPEFFLKVDGRTSISRIFTSVKWKLRILNAHRVLIPEKILIANSLDIEGEGGHFESKKHYNLNDLNECFRDFSKKKVVNPMYKWIMSDWGTRCPVAMAEGSYINGDPNYAVNFMNTIFFLSSQDAFIKFQRNPRPFLLPPNPRSHGKIFVIGPTCSGKTAVANSLGYLINCTVLSPIDLYKQFMEQKRDNLFERMRQAMITDKLTSINKEQLHHHQMEKHIFQERINTWLEGFRKYIQKEIDKLKKQKSEPTLSSFPVLMGLKETEEEVEEEESFDGIFVTGDTALELLENPHKMKLYLPEKLTRELPDVIPTTALSDSNLKDIEDLLRTSDTDEIVLGEEDLLDMYGTAIRHEEEKYILRENIKGGWIIDGLSFDFQFFQRVYDECPPEHVIILEDSSGGDFLLDRYKIRGLNVFTDYQNFFQSIGKPDIAESCHMEEPENFKELLVRDILLDILNSKPFLVEPGDDEEISEKTLLSRRASQINYKLELEEFDENKLKIVSFLNSMKKDCIVFDVYNKSFKNLLEEIVLTFENKYRAFAVAFSDIDRLEESRDFGNNIAIEGDGEGINQRNGDEFEMNRHYGDTYRFCPVSIHDKWVLWKGREEHIATFLGKIYLCSSEADLDAFIRDPRKYLPISKSLPAFPPPRICVTGFTGSGKTSISRAISKNFALCNFSFMDFLTAKGFDDENSDNYQQIQDYLSSDTPLPEEIVQEFIDDLWFKGQNKSIGFVIDDFPKRPSDIAAMVRHKAIPDIIINLKVSEKELRQRTILKHMDEWQIKMDQFRLQQKEKHMQYLIKWEQDRRERFEQLMEIRRQDRYSTKRQDKDQKGAKPVRPYMEDLEETDDETDRTIRSKSQVTFDSVEEQEDIDEVNKQLIEEMPEPVFVSDIESIEEATERIKITFENTYVKENEFMEAMRDLSISALIAWEDMKSEKQLEVAQYESFLAVDKFTCRNKSFFERTYEVSIEIAERLLTSGYFFLSMFGRTCPVQYFKRDIPVQLFIPMEQTFNVFPIIHRQYIYFVVGKDSRNAFREDPLLYVDIKAFKFPLLPIRLAIIGPPKCGKSALADRFRTELGIKVISKGQAARYVMNYLPHSSLGASMEIRLRAGLDLKEKMVLSCVEAATFDPRAVTQGILMDGFPNSSKEVKYLASMGLMPQLVIDLYTDKADIYEYVSSEAMKLFEPPYSKHFMRHRYKIWESSQNEFRLWLDREYQNIIKIPIDTCMWNIWDETFEMVKAGIYEILHYHIHAKDNWPLRLSYMLVSPLEFLERQSPYKIYCPCCLYFKNELVSSNFPPDRTGLVHFKKYFYYICPKHMEQFLETPDLYLLPYNPNKLPDNTPERKKLTAMPENVYEDGYCVICYMEQSKTVKGNVECASQFGSVIYLFDMPECQEKFMTCPHFYFDAKVILKSNITYPTLTYEGLPPLGTLEQFVAKDVINAIKSTASIRPVIPGLSVEQSALVTVAMFLKINNKKLKKDEIDRYKKALEVLLGKRKTLLEVLEMFKTHRNPFIYYEEPVPALRISEWIKEKFRRDVPSWSYTDIKEDKAFRDRRHQSARRVPVPDARFDYLCEYFKPLSKVPAFLNVVDIAGLVKGASEGQGLGNAFLSHISACDTIFHLCRVFEDDDVTHVEGDVNPVRDLEIIYEELRLKDEETLEKALDKIGRVVERGGDKKLKPEYDTLQKVKHVLEEEKNHIRFSDWDAKDIEILNRYLFLTSKPALYLVNLSEKDYIKKKNKWLIKIKEWVDKHDPGALIIPFSGVFEHKLVEEYEDPVLRKKFLEDNNVTSALDKIIVNGYKALQLEYFFTSGPDEVKAWTIQKGTKAPQAAGRIHTDFEKGFIMAEVMKFNDFKEEGSEAACKAAGKYRQQGRNYVVEDGDIIFFKFNAGAGLKDAKKK